MRTSNTIGDTEDFMTELSTTTQFPVIDDAEDYALQEPDKNLTETATFPLLLGAVPEQPNLANIQPLDIPVPFMSPALPESEETHSPAKTADQSDDTVILPTVDDIPEIPKYIKQQKTLMKHNLVVKIPRLSEATINKYKKSAATTSK